MERLIALGVLLGIAFQTVAGSPLDALELHQRAATTSQPVVTVTFPNERAVTHQVGSLVGITSASTTVVLGCAENESSCDYSTAPATITQAPMHYIERWTTTWSDYPAYALSYNCTFDSTGAFCKVAGQPVSTWPASGINPDEVRSFFYSSSQYQVAPVTMTAGALAQLTGGAAPTPNAGQRLTRGPMIAGLLVVAGILI